MLEVKLLGQFDVRQGGVPIPIPSRASQSLFAYLLLTAGTEHRREKLAGLLWPNASEENARSNLRHELWRLRKAIETRSPRKRAVNYLSVDEISIAFDANSDYWLDTAFLQRISDASANDLIESLSVYRGELLPGFYDEWIVLERERLRAIFEQKMARLLDALIEEQRWRDVLDWGERWIALGQSPEPAYRALMTGHSAMGDMSKVASAFERCAQALRNDLGVEPSDQTRALHERLTSMEKTKRAEVRSQIDVAQRTPSEAITTPSRVPTARNNLPIPLTSFVGREKEIEQVKRLLSATRLLTLTGAGGVGKTRLAIQVAMDLVETFSAGVWWGELVALSDASLVPQAVAKALNVREVPNQPLSETLANYLHSKQLLLVLDNCEHLVAACARLAEDLLSACSNLKILATSREALGILGETAFGVPSLSLPDSQHLPETANLTQYESIQLFVDRAAAVHSGFGLNEQNASAVSQICQGLDGIPLAIELAAARVKVLSAQEIAVGLNDRFNVLTAGSRTALARHQTLRATIDWSYALLNEPERILFRRLSVFAGGFTMESAIPVCTGMGVEQAQVLDLLSRLVDKSLVMVDYQSSGEARFRLLETIREYAREKLIDAEEADAVRDRHLEFFAKLAEGAESRLFSAESVTWFMRLEAERDNLRAAMDWSLENDEVIGALRIVGALEYFWFSHGPLSESEGQERLRQVLSRPKAQEPTVARAKALNTIGLFYWADRNVTDARPKLEEALAIGTALGDKQSIAESLTFLGMVNNLQGDYVAARASLERSLAIGRELGVEGKLGVSWSLIFLGEVALNQRRFEEAQRLFEKGVTIRREIQDKNLLAYALRRLGQLAWHESDYERAMALCKESLTLNMEIGDRRGVAACLAAFAGIAVAQTKWARAAKIFGVVEVLLRAIGATLLPLDRAEYDRNVATLRAQLAEATFAAAWAEGRAMTLEQAIEYALEERAK